MLRNGGEILRSVPQKLRKSFANENPTLFSVFLIPENSENKTIFEVEAIDKEFNGTLDINIISQVKFYSLSIFNMKSQMKLKLIFVFKIMCY